MNSVELTSLKKHSYTLTESLRALRTNIQFCGDDVKTILFTSAMPDEGKSTVVMDLARSIAEADKRVLVIDTDMRKSLLIGRLRAHTEGEEKIYGLSHYLSGQQSMDKVFCSTNVPNLFMVFLGPSVPNPMEILEKEYFSRLIAFARDHFDYVLVDCAPIGAAIDAAVIGRKCDAAVLVVAQGQVSSRMINSVKKQLEVSGVRILGAVMNKVNMKKNSYYGKYYGSYYGNYGNKE